MKGFMVIVASILVTLSCVTPTQGVNPHDDARMEATLYVGGSGPGNYTTIQQAINASNNGDTIYVFNDSAPYYEYLTIPKTITLQGEDRNSTIIIGNDTADTIHVTTDGVTIKEFLIKNTAEWWPYPACINVHANNVILTDLVIQTSELGIRLNASSHCLISESYFRWNGISIRLEHDSTFNRITHNSIRSSSFDLQVELFACPDNTIDNNTVTNEDEMSIYANDSLRTHIMDNILIGNEYGICLVLSNSSQIHGNLCENNTVAGLGMGMCTDCEITDNVFVHDGLEVYQCYGNTMTGNLLNGAPIRYLERETDQTITQNGGQVILINCTAITIRDSVLTDANLAVQCWNCNDCVITNNNLTSCLSSITLENCKGTTISDNTISDSRWEIFFNLLDVRNCHDTTIVHNDLGFSSDLGEAAIGGSTNVKFVNNIVHGTYTNVYSRLICSSSRHVIIRDNVFESGGIGLSVCHNALVENNALQQGVIAVEYGILNRIIKNDIHPPAGDRGIILTRVKLGFVRDNTVTDGNGSITLTSCRVMIMRGNSFVNCGDEPASFTNCLWNHWSHNYWGEPLSQPKIIHGEIRITYGDWPNYHTIKIPVTNIDRTPKQAP